MPLSGANEGTVYDMGTMHEDDSNTPEDERDGWIFRTNSNVGRGGFGLDQVIKVHHEDKDKVVFTAVDSRATDANGENENALASRPPAVWLSDLTRAGTKRLGHIAISPPANASARIFDAHEQMGNTLYLLGRVEGRGITNNNGEYPHVPLRVFAINLDAAHIPHTSLPNANATSGGARQLSGDSPFLVRFNGKVYYRRSGNLYHASPVTPDELVLDTESGGTIAGGSAAPLNFAGKLYFVARIGGTDSGQWFVYTYDGISSLTRVAFLGTGAGVAPRLLRSSAVPGIPSLVANDNIYFLDEIAPTFSTALSLATSGAGETNALFTFVSSERASYSWVVTESATVPSSSQLRAAFDDANSEPVAHNFLSDQLSLPDSTEAFEVSGLTSGTDYHLHLVLVDGAGNESEVASVAFTTLGTGGDAVLDLPPTLSAPLSVSSLTQVDVSSDRVILTQAAEVSLTYTPSEPSTAHWVLVPFSEPAPSRAQVVSGVRSDGGAANSGSQTVSSAESQTLTLASNFTSNPPRVLLPSAPGMDVECRVYVVLQDTNGDLSPLYTTYFTTQEDNTRERILTVEDFAVTLSGTTATATFTALGDDFDGLWWLSLPSNAPPVTRRFLLAGTTFDGLSVPSGHSGISLAGVDEDDTGTFEVTNLEVGLSYTLYFTARTGAGVLSSDSNTTSDDYLPVQSHTFSAGAPFLAISGVVVDNASSSASVSFTTPISGNYYWLVQGSSLPFLSGFQIFSGLNANGVRPSTGLVSAAGVATDVDNPNTFSVEELPISGDYLVYVTIRSSSGILYRPEASPFSYTVDGTRLPAAPHFASGPSVSEVSFQTASVSFAPTGPGAYYWILQESSTATPTTTQIVAGQDGSGAMAMAGSTAAVPLTGPISFEDLGGVRIDLSALTPGTDYTVYIVLSNTAGANPREAVAVSFTTDAISLVATPVLTKNPNNLTQAGATFQSTHAGTYCWVALGPGVDVPDVEAITDAARRGMLQPEASLRGKGEIPAARADVILSMSNLLPGTAYTVYIALSNSGYSILSSYFLSFDTDALDLTRNLSVSTVTDPLRVEATFQANYTGKYCWVVLPSGAPTPSRQDIAIRERREQIQTKSSFEGRGSVPAARAAVNFQPQDLVTSTDYDLHLVVSHRDLRFAGPFSASFQTNDMSVDITQAVSNSSSTNQAHVKVTSNVAGNLYWVVLPQGTTAPTVAQLRTASERSTLQSNADLHGGPHVITSTGPRGFFPGGLTEGTDYTIHVVVVGDNGSLSNVVSRNFTHSTTPSLADFRVDEITSAQARVRFQPSWRGTYFWVVLPQSDVDGNGAPSPTQVRAGQNGVGEATSFRGPDVGAVIGVRPGTTFAREITFRPSGLSPETAYRVYVVLLGPNPTSALGPVHDMAFTTEAAPSSSPPSFTQAPSVGSITATTASVSFTPANAVRYDWVLVSGTSAGTKPSATQVRAGTDSSDMMADDRSASGGVSFTGDDAITFSLSGLTAGTSYHLYLVLSNAAGDADSAVEGADFTTKAAPSFTQVPTVGSVTDTTASVSFTPSNAARYDWVLLSGTSAGTAPSAAQVRAGTDSSDMMADARSADGGVSLTGDDAITFSLSGLTAGTDYHLYLVLSNAAGDADSTVEGADFTTTTSSVSPSPSFAQVPMVSSITATTASVSFTPSNAVRYDWVLLSGASAGTKPSAAQVRAGTDSSDMMAAARSADGGVSLPGDAAVTFPLLGLTADTSYHLYLVLSNAAGDADSAVEGVAFMTAPPPPTFTEVPTVGSITATTASVSFTPSAAGRYCWVLLDGASSAPSRDQVLRGEDSSGTAASFRSPPGGVLLTGDAAVTFPLSGLSPGTSYHLYLVLSSTANDAFSVVSDVSFTTVAAPSFSSSPSVSSVAPFSAEVSFTPSDAHRYCWVLLDGASSAPSRAQVLRGEDSSGTAAALRSPVGGVAIPSGGGPVSISLLNLSFGTDYALFIVLANASNDAFSPVVDVDFATPGFSVSISSITPDAVTPTTAAVRFRSNVPGSYYWLAITSGSAAPTQAQVTDATLRASFQPSANLRGTDMIAAAGDVTFSITGLAVGTSYDLFLVVEVSGSIFSDLVTDSFTQGTAVVRPSFTAPPSVSSVTATAASVSFTPRDAARYDWVLVSGASAGTAPSEDQVRTGLDASGMMAAARSADGGVVLSGDTVVTFLLSGLTADTSYHLYLVLSNATDTLFSAVEGAPFTTISAPSFGPPGHPVVNAFGPDSAAFRFTPQDASRYCWVLLTAASVTASGAPSSFQVRHGQDGGGVLAPFRSAAGGVSIAVAGAVDFSVSGLSPGTSYQLFAVLANASNDAFSPVASTSFATTLAPSFGPPGRPVVVSSGADSIAFRFMPQNAHRYCWVLLTATSVTASGVPSSFQVRHGQDGGGVLAPHRSTAGGVPIAVSGAVDFSVLGLLPETSYQLFMVLANTSNDAFSSVASVSSTTAPALAPPPTFTSGPTVAQHSTVRTTAVVTFAPSTIGRYYWVVQSESVANNPTSTHVRNGLDGNGAAVPSGLTNAPSGADAPASAVTFEIPSLEEDTAYALHLLLVSAAGIEGTVSSHPFTLPGIGLGGLDKGLSISPNPVSDFLRVTVPVPDVVFELYSLSGDLLHRGTYSAGTHMFPFSDYSPGVYVLRISFGVHLFSRRLVKR